MKRILFVINDFVSGGAETQLFYLLDHLKNFKEYEITIMHLGVINPKFFETKINLLKDIEIIEFDNFRVSKTITSFLLSYFKLYKILKNKKFDVIIPYHRNTSIIFSFINFFLGKKCFFQERGGEINLVSPPNFIMKKLLILSNPIFIANNKSSAKLLANKFNIKLSQINVIYNGISDCVFNFNTIEIKENYRIKHSKLVLTFVANYYPEKNHLQLIEALILLNKKEQFNGVLLLVGNDPEGLKINQLKSFVKQNFIEDKVLFLENVYDVKPILSITDIGLFASKSEGLANSLIEYIQFSIPSIVSRIPVFEEVLGEDYPYFFNISETESLVLLLEEMFENSNRKQVGIEFNKNHYYKFKLENMLNKFKSLIDEN